MQRNKGRCGKLGEMNMTAWRKGDKQSSVGPHYGSWTLEYWVGFLMCG